MKDTIAKSRTRTIKAIGRRARGSVRAAAARALAFLGFFIVLAGISIFELPSAMKTEEFLIGEPAPRTLFSPIEITYVNEGETAARREAQVRRVLPVFRLDREALKSALPKLTLLFEEPAAEPGPRFAELPESTLKFLRDRGRAEEMRALMRRILQRGFDEGVLDYSEKLRLAESGVSEITVLDGREEKNVTLAEVLTTGENPDSISRFLAPDAVKNRALKNAVSDAANALLTRNLRVADDETQLRRKRAAAEAPPAEETIKRDELLIQRGMLITAEEKGRLDRVQKTLAERKAVNQMLATAGILFTACLLCLLYLALLDKKTFASWRRILLFQAVVVLDILVCKIVLLWPGSSPYLIPAALAPLLMVLLMPARLAVVSALLVTAVTTPMVKFLPDVTLAVLFSCIAAIFGGQRVRKRIHFLRAGAVIGLSSFLMLFAYRLFQEYPVSESLEVSALGLASGLLIATPLCFLLLPLLEWIFDLTTDITLLELSDLNHPILKRMIVEAPGTYHHSLVVSTLAESACEAIGANALLARVGCYFHDIGKIARAEFFIENQSTGRFPNKHEKLSANMSCLVIQNHVKDGMELGRQHKLRQPILRFIPEHQGTGIVYFFYRKALDQAKPGDKINADDFRYPGPKPQSRETAIAMLADSVEASSRSMREPSPESIRQHVRKVINEKFIDGQLDECDLTLRDLHRIQESFVYNLMAIFHTRVKYPAAAEDGSSPDLFCEAPLPKPRPDVPKRHPETH